MSDGWRDVHVTVTGPHPRMFTTHAFRVNTENYATEIGNGPFWKWRVERAVRRLCKKQDRLDHRAARVRGQH